MKVVIVIPSYNERRSIGNTLERLDLVIKKIKGHSVGVLVVDDNSPDGTATIVYDKAKKYKYIELITGEKKGLGAAYARGIPYAISKMKAEVVFEMDADGQHDPIYILDFLKKIDEGYDYVIGSRYVKGGSIPKEWGLHRKLLSFLGSLFARFMLKTSWIKDYTSGYKASRVEGYLEKIDLNSLISPHFAYKIELLYKMLKMGAKTTEIPINFKGRDTDSSKSTFTDLMESFKVVFLLRLREHKRFVKVCIVGAIGAFIQFVAYYILKFIFFKFTGVSFGSFYISQKAFFNAVAVELAIMTNFIINNLWSFKDRKLLINLNFTIKFLQFNFFVLGSLIIQAFVLEFGTRATKIDNNFFDFILISIGILIGLAYNYLIYKNVIWKIKKN